MVARELLLEVPRMWLANALTLARIPLAALFWLTYGDRRWSLAIIVAAGLTDAVDGTVARRARSRNPDASSAGEWLDPLADKVFVLCVLAAAVVHGTTTWPLVLLVCARELVLIPLIVAYRMTRPRPAHVYQADRLGKATTIVQLGAVTAIVADLTVAPVLAVVACGLGLAAAAHYIARGLMRGMPATVRISPRARRRPWSGSSSWTDRHPPSEPPARMR
jgi:phosphatidylglycerophosphate synthase